MLFDLPDQASLYDALLARDATYDGRVYVCVSSTGIFLSADLSGAQTKA